MDLRCGRNKNRQAGAVDRTGLVLAAVLACLTLQACLTQDAFQAAGEVASSVSSAVSGVSGAMDAGVQVTASAASAHRGSGDAAQAMRSAAAICLRNFRDLDAALGEFRAGGWEVRPYIDPGAYEIEQGAVYAILSVPDNTCAVKTGDLSLAQARAIGTSLVKEYFPGQYQAGAPEGRSGPCDGYTVFPGRGLIVMSYAAAGNSGECIENNGSAIILDM